MIMKKYLTTVLSTVLSFGTLSGTAQLQSFEGYYRNPNDDKMIVHLIVEKDTLMAKPLWNNQTYHLRPIRDLVFNTIEDVQDGPLTLTFSRDAGGGMTNLSLGNGDRWTRDKNYKPEVKKEMAHTPEQLRAYEGLYRLDWEGQRFLQLYVKDNTLVLRQLWNGKQFPFQPESKQDFFSYQMPQFTLHFTVDSTGNVTKVLAMGQDVWVRAKTAVLTEKELMVAQGKYHLTDQTDHQVTVTVRNNSLIIDQQWDNKEFVFASLTTTYFYDEKQNCTLELSGIVGGKAKSLILNGTNIFERVP